VAILRPVMATTLTRRTFVFGSLGAAVAVLPANARPGDRMRYAMSGHQFTPLEPHPETGIAMAARYGYHGIEPFQNDVVKYINRPPAVFKDVLDRSGLALCTIGSGGQYFDRARLQDTIAANGATAHYIRQMGCRHLKVNLNRRLSAADLTPDEARTLAANLNEVGRRTADEGIRLAVHPHAWTMVERKIELEMMLDMTNPDLVSIVLDTCHAAVGGIDPVQCLGDYYSRIASIHLKDTLPRWNPAAGWKGPAPTQDEHKQLSIYQRLGSGGVDFPAFFRVLRERRYSGWVTLDFNAVDMPPNTSVEQDMNAHRKYLIDVLHADLKQ
jgi:inosose dehydratase